MVSPEDEEEEEEEPESMMLGTSTGKRPLFRTSQGKSALEIDLSKEAEDAEPTPDGIENKGELVADLTTHGQQFVLCKGGRGGLGNRNFATAARQTPRFAQPGEEGTNEGEYFFELRIIAEVGLVAGTALVGGAAHEA